MNTKLKEIINKGTGIDTTLLPPVLPLNIRKSDITTVTKSKTPVLTEETWERYYNYLNENLNRFQRRNFEEFSYLKVVPKTWVVILLYILALGISIGINFWTFNNEFNEEGKNYNARSGYYSRTFNSKFRRY